MTRRRKPLRSPFVISVAAGTGMMAALACGTAQHTSPLGTNPGAQDGGGPPVAAGPCSPSGETRSCHVNLGKSGSVQQCFVGTQTCVDGQWTACGGSGVVQNVMSQQVSASGYHAEALIASTPLTCTTANACTPLTTCNVAVCGEEDDGCGGVVKCGPNAGACPVGQFCQSGQCLSSTCVGTPVAQQAAACTAAGLTCGSMSDTCGNAWSCGTCMAGNLCAGGTCEPIPACTPLTCANVITGGASCGHYDNGCGADLDCDTPGCTGLNTCQSGTCAPGVCVGIVGAIAQTAACLAANLGVGAVCGLLSDSCDGDFSCGTCPDAAHGQECVNGQCTPLCTPATSCPPGVLCGTRSDGCGGTINCGTCGAPAFCASNGTVCETSGSCTPISGAANITAACTQAGAQCGNLSDGCLGTIACPACPYPSAQTCQFNQCTPSCTPTTCAAQGIQCGHIDDGCGNDLNCDVMAGGCTGPQTCGGGGIPGQCGTGACSAATAATQCGATANQCGAVSDGCDGTIACPSCAATALCTGGIGLPVPPPTSSGGSCAPGGAITPGGSGGTFTCATGQSCVLDCSAGGACTSAVTVNGGGNWTINCGPGSCTNHIDCSGGPTCIINCEGGGSCTNHVTCNAANNCEIACSGSGACTNHVDCTAPECDVTCSGNGSCTNHITETVGSGTGCVACTGSGDCSMSPTCTGTNCNVAAATCPCSAGGGSTGGNIICSTDPCDPYCMETDMADAGAGALGDAGGVVDYVPFGTGQVTTSEVNEINNVCSGGVCAGGGGCSCGGTTGGSLLVTANGQSACAGATNLTTDCSPVSDCQQDYRCVGGTGGACTWNGGLGYSNASAGGVDLTIGTACVTGGGLDVFPVCNRGSVATASAATININLVGTGTVPSGCSAVGPATCTATAPTGGLQPGQCMDVPCAVAANGYAVVYGPAEGAGLCANNAAAAYVTGTAGCDSCATPTFVKGVVTDPAMLRPLPNIVVYQAVSTPLPTLDPSGTATCDTCASLVPPAYAETSTAVDGTFDMQVFPQGGDVDVVIQTGHWRKLVSLAGVVAGSTTNLTAAQSRLPQTAAEGDIPHIAVFTGAYNDPLECEMAMYMGGTGEMGGGGSGKRIEVFQSDGVKASPNVAASTIWGSSANLDAFDMVLFPCGGPTLSSGEKTNFKSYLESGGKLFIDHVPAWQLLTTSSPGGIAPLDTAETYAAGGPGGGSNLYVKNLGTDPAHVLFEHWLSNQGALSAAYGGSVFTPQPRSEAQTPNASFTTEWLRGELTDNWGPHPGGDFSASYSFDLNGGGLVTLPATGCGRVVYNGMHVDQSRGSTNSSSTFPGSCSFGPPIAGGASLSANELGLEYLLYVLSGCAASVAPVPPPPAPSGCENYQYSGASGPVGFFSCQMDTYCDPKSLGGSGNCVPFNQGQTWTTPTALNMGATTGGGVDLTIEQGCAPMEGGSGYYQDFPICNRGNTTLTPAMSTTGNIAVAMLNYSAVNAPPFEPPGACPTTTDFSTAGAQVCSVPIPATGLAPGQCMLIDLSADCGANDVTAELSYDQLLFVNSDNAVTEDSLTPNTLLTTQVTPQNGCANNWGIDPGSPSAANNPPACAGGTAYVSQTATYTYTTSSCPAGTHGQWSQLTYNATIGTTATESAEVRFLVSTQPVNLDGTLGTATPFVTIADAMGVLGATPQGDPAVCTEAGPAADAACTNTNALTSSPATCCPKFIWSGLEQSTTASPDQGLGLAPGTVAALNQNLILQITINPTSDGTQTATLQNWQVSFDCVPSE